MAGYEVFSAFYDALTENVEYEAWAEYILALFERFSEKRPQTVLDLACGTGSLTERLLQRGLRVIGVDGSAVMLAAAQQKYRAAIITYLIQALFYRKMLDFSID